VILYLIIEGHISSAPIAQMQTNNPSITPIGGKLPAIGFPLFTSYLAKCFLGVEH